MTRTDWLRPPCPPPGYRQESVPTAIGLALKQTRISPPLGWPNGYHARPIACLYCGNHGHIYPSECKTCGAPLPEPKF